MSWKNRIVGHGEQAAISFMANPLNWRIHPKAQREALTGVLSEVGWVQSVIVNRTTGNVVDGHARIEEALKLGDETPVPFVEVELSEEEEKQVLLTLDPISAMAAADKQNLDALLHDVSTASSAVADMLTELAEKNGLEYGATIGGELEDVEPQVDRADELRQKWGVEAGQIWQLGEHRLMCGDSTSDEDMTRLINGEKINAVVTDPPYGIGYKYDQHDDNREEWFLLMNKIVPKLRKLAQFVVMPSCGIDRLGWWYKNHSPDWLLCWYKGSPGHLSKVGFNDWEAHLAWGRPSTPMHDYWQTKCGFDIDGHPCPKPIEYSIWLVDRAAKKSECIYEPFGGSGTTIMAAEQLGRKCYAMEISLAYVGVILERWSQATGKTPELVA